MQDARLTVVPGFDNHKAPGVIELHFTPEILRIRVSDDPTSLAVSFSNVLGFRVLDEGDLLGFWSSEYTPGGWLYQVESGGWLEQESVRVGFSSKELEGLREYLVVTSFDCVSVLSFDEPTKLGAAN